MKKSLLLLGFISCFSFGQITDENGNSAASSNGTPLSGGIKIGTSNANSTLEIFGITSISNGGAEAMVFGQDFYGGELGIMTTEDEIMAIKFNNRFEYGGGIPGSGRLVVTQAGDVGIGTINPRYKFDIYGQNALAINGCAIADVNKSSGIIKIGDIDGEDAQLALYDNSTSEIVRIANGSVGIGTTNPSYKLDVLGTALFSEGSERISIGLDYYGGEIGMMTTADDILAVKFNNRFEYGGGIPGSGRLVVTQAGNVGVGTTTPDEKLSVNGTIHAKEVRVDLIGWPDYVFDENYELTPLGDLKKFIETNKHLPNIPSANDIEFNGLNLGNMQTKQMEKIEELTLYIIEQEERIKKLEDLVKELVSEKTSNNKN